MTSFDFGDFKWICNRASLTLCPALNLSDPDCYSRNVAFNDLLIFQPSVLAVNLTAIIMTLIMINHIKSKYTAVGRKEMVIFFYYYLLSVILELMLLTNIIPLEAKVYKWVAAGHVASITSAISVLLINGFVGFQWVEDGTRVSVWTFRLVSICVFAAVYFVSICTFMDILGMNRDFPIVLYIIFFIYNGAAILLYVLLQVFLVVNTLHIRWPLGDIFFGLVFLAMGCTAIFGFSNQICEFATHYLDGMFLGSAFILLSVMMVYKYWDSITSEDLEYAVGSGMQVWHLKNTMDEDDELLTNNNFNSGKKRLSRVCASMDRIQE